MKILMMVDNRKESALALDALLCRDWPTGSEFLVVGVVPRRYLPPPPPSMLEVLAGGELERSDETARVRIQVQLAVEALKSSGWDASGKVRTGRRVAELVAEAHAWDADLIVIGAPASTPLWEGLLGGDWLSSVVANAPCTVEVIREKPNAPKRKTGRAAPRSSSRRVPALHAPS